MRVLAIMLITMALIVGCSTIQPPVTSPLPKGGSLLETSEGLISENRIVESSEHDLHGGPIGLTATPPNLFFLDVSDLGNGDFYYLDPEMGEVWRVRNSSHTALNLVRTGFEIFFLPDRTTFTQSLNGRRFALVVSDVGSGNHEIWVVDSAMNFAFVLKRVAQAAPPSVVFSPNGDLLAIRLGPDLPIEISLLDPREQGNVIGTCTHENPTHTASLKCGDLVWGTQSDKLVWQDSRGLWLYEIGEDAPKMIVQPISPDQDREFNQGEGIVVAYEPLVFSPSGRFLLVREPHYETADLKVLDMTSGEVFNVSLGEFELGAELHYVFVAENEVVVSSFAAITRWSIDPNTSEKVSLVLQKTYHNENYAGTGALALLGDEILLVADIQTRTIEGSPHITGLFMIDPMTLETLEVLMVPWEHAYFGVIHNVLGNDLVAFESHNGEHLFIRLDPLGIAEIPELDSTCCFVAITYE